MSNDLGRVQDQVRTILATHTTTPQDRAEFVYAITRHMYDYVKFEVLGPQGRAELERYRELCNAALPPAQQNPEPTH